MWSEVLAYLVVACGYHLDPESRRSGRVSEMGESLDLVEVSKHSLSGYTTMHVSSRSASARDRKKYLNRSVLAAKVDGFECGGVGSAEDVANIVGRVY